MAEITDVVTLITILKNLLISGIQVDQDTREKIATMSDEEIIAYARELVADTDKQAGEFLDRLDKENPKPE